MTFSEVLPALLEGKRIQRGKNVCGFILVNGYFCYDNREQCSPDLTATDYEVVAMEDVEWPETL